MQDSAIIPVDQGMVGSQGTGNAPPGYEPTHEEEQAIKLVEKYFSKAKAARRPYDEKWLDYYKMFRGKQWKEQRPSYRHSEVINLIFRAIQSDVPILTDGMPKPEFVPQEPGDLPLAEILNDVLNSDWTSGNWLEKLTEVIYDAHFYGAGFGGMPYDPEAANGAGRIIFQSEDPFCAYPDPAARNVNEKANYFTYAEPTDVEALKRDYPDKAQWIKPDLIDMTKRERANFSEQMRYKSPTDTRNISQGQTTADLESKDEALKITLYIHDSSYCEDEIKEKDPETGEEKTAYMQRLQYPKGRKLVSVGGVLCENGEIEYEDKKFPYLRLLNYILPREFWGISEVEQLESPQKIFNKLISYALDVLTLMGNPIWIVDDDSGVDTDNLFNRPGLVVEKSKGSEVRREEGVALQPYVLQLIDRMKLWFDDVSGSSDSSRGIQPGQVTAASAIEALQQAGQTRLRQKTRNIDAFMQDFGKMYASRVFQYYDAPRVFRVTADNNTSKYFKFHIEKRPVTQPQEVMDPATGQMMIQDVPTGEIKKIAKVRHFQMGDDGNHYLGQEQEFEAQGEFDVRVSTGSALPFEKNRIEQQTYALYDRNIIDDEEVLKNIKYPNAEAVLQRMAEKKAMAAQQEAMAKAQGQAPPPAA